MAEMIGTTRARVLQWRH